MDNCNKGLGFGNNIKVSSQRNHKLLHPSLVRGGGGGWGVGVGVEREVRGKVGGKSKINSSIENSINSNSPSGRTFSQFV